MPCPFLYMHIEYHISEYMRQRLFVTYRICPIKGLGKWRVFWAEISRGNQCSGMERRRNPTSEKLLCTASLRNTIINLCWNALIAVNLGYGSSVLKLTPCRPWSSAALAVGRRGTGQRWPQLCGRGAPALVQGSMEWEDTGRFTSKLWDSVYLNAFWVKENLLLNSSELDFRGLDNQSQSELHPLCTRPVNFLSYPTLVNQNGIFLTNAN